MKVIITGANGQLGSALVAHLQAHDTYPFDSSSLDICNSKAVTNVFQSIKPDAVINAAAYTAVDKAESETDRANAVNHLALTEIAQQSSNLNCRLIHISTDFVFDGLRGIPYTESDQPNPINSYGRSKREGELALLSYYSSATIIRTSWLYSSSHQNFVKTMLRLMSERAELKVVCDQIGSPTAVSGLVELIENATSHPRANGIFHWSDAGVASWYDFAVAIYEEALQLGILSNEVKIMPVTSQEFPAAAKRPHFSVMNKQKTYQTFGMIPIHWRVKLRQTLQELKR